MKFCVNKKKQQQNSCQVVAEKSTWQNTTLKKQKQKIHAPGVIRTQKLIFSISRSPTP